MSNINTKLWYSPWDLLIGSMTSCGAWAQAHSSPGPSAKLQFWFRWSNMDQIGPLGPISNRAHVQIDPNGPCQAQINQKNLNGPAETGPNGVGPTKEKRMSATSCGLDMERLAMTCFGALNTGSGFSHHQVSIRQAWKIIDYRAQTSIEHY